VLPKSLLGQKNLCAEFQGSPVSKMLAALGFARAFVTAADFCPVKIATGRFF
jgi:hypothetical protein